jgi:hypothetical protein
MNDKNDKEDKITNDADKSLVPVIITIVIGWVLLAILACVIPAHENTWQIGICHPACVHVCVKRLFPHSLLQIFLNYLTLF